MFAMNTSPKFVAQKQRLKLSAFPTYTLPNTIPITVCNKVVHMLYIPPNAAALIISGLSAEISRQSAIGAVCGDDWPNDFDPNDAALYREYIEWLRSNEGHLILEDNPNSKPVRLVFALIPHFVRERTGTLTSNDMESAFCIFNQYVVMRCLHMLETRSENASERRNIMHLLGQVIAFPGRENEVQTATASYDF